MGMTRDIKPPMPAPKVSVGMPAYNSSSWIEMAISSILGQTFSDLELIISDNASTDGTYEICERLARRDSRVRLLRNPVNIGANRNYLAVLDAARAPYFKWATSSDWCAPTFLERCIAALEREPRAVLACPRTLAFEDSPATGLPVPANLDLSSAESAERFIELLSKPGLNNAVNGVIRRAALLRASRLGVYMGADIVLMAELALMGKFVLIPEDLFYRRMIAQTATKLKSAEEMERHLVPTARAPLKWQHWRYHLGLLNATRFGGFPGRNWFAAVSYALRAVVWARQRLVRDAWFSLRASSAKS
jgi:glycosyltransferase involved in cell wall biosynthesis